MPLLNRKLPERIDRYGDREARQELRRIFEVDAENNAVGLLHEEMRRAGSLILRTADAHKLPAGGALAVDRHGFSAAITQALAE